MILRLKPATIGFAFALASAACALIVSVVIGAIGFLWLIAGILDGRWEAGLAFVIWFTLSAVQLWLFFHGIRHAESGRSRKATLYLLGSTLPAAVFLYVVTL